jgi:hypothetical protein
MGGRNEDDRDKQSYRVACTLVLVLSHRWKDNCCAANAEVLNVGYGTHPPEAQTIRPPCLGKDRNRTYRVLNAFRIYAPFPAALPSPTNFPLRTPHAMIFLPFRSYSSTLVMS